MTRGTTPLKITPLYDEHIKLGAKMTDFGGWNMPLYFSGILAEHKAVREDVGICDASHMGQVFVRGRDAKNFVNFLVPNEIGSKKPGHAIYTMMCNENGGIIDDLLVYVIHQNDIMLIVNATRRSEVLIWMDGMAARRNYSDLRIEPHWDDRGLISIQGPNAEDHLQELAESVNLSGIQPFTLTAGEVCGQECYISRTGYTGEDGFELIGHANHVATIWRALIKGGATPVGLGARDTLRQEMGYPLYGNDLDEITTPIEADLNWTVKFDKPAFYGRDAMKHLIEHGLPKVRVGLEFGERAIPRHGCQIYVEGRRIGQVTSGCFSPTLRRGIAQAYVEPAYSKLGTVLDVEIRNQRFPGTVTKMPFHAAGSRTRKK